MEKHSSRSLAKKTRPVNDDSYDISSLKIGRRTEVPEKPSREDVSLCINIWARLYRLDSGTSDRSKLHLPSRPWTGRSRSNLKRYD
jgi:hypothetical protein